jgi:hypothetical protein
MLTFICSVAAATLCRLRLTFAAFEATFGADLAPGSYFSARDDDGHGTHTATTAAGNAAEGVVNGTAAGALYPYGTVLGRIFQYATVSTADGDFVRITAYITVSTTGNLSIQWAQNSSTVNALQLRRGSWLRAVQVS